MSQRDRIYVAGHRGLVGSAIVRRLRVLGYENLIVRDRTRLDLTDTRAVDAFFEETRPDFVFLAAAKVGGILANETFPADFLRKNLQIELNVIDAAYRHRVRKLQFLGSSCIYPKHAPQPLREESLLSGPLEPTNQSYAVAKIAGIHLCQAYAQQHDFDAIALMPTNLYGPGDNFHPEYAHVVPALMGRFHEAVRAKADEVVVWGTGTPLRELLFVDDLADAAVFLMQHYAETEIINVGTGQEITIRHLAEQIADVVGFRGAIRFDAAKADGTPRKLLDVSRITALGWRPSTSLAEGLRATYRWFLEHESERRGLQTAYSTN
ncbi:MAG: GDP-L-fucose synthase [Planctomycetota bacterium]|nr:MAG: GDP-L-fucose synthase [Planctomycetota bacterium]